MAKDNGTIAAVVIISIVEAVERAVAEAVPVDRCGSRIEAAAAAEDAAVLTTTTLITEETTAEEAAAVVPDTGIRRRLKSNAQRARPSTYATSNF